MMSKEKQAAIEDISNRIFASMMDDIVMDTVIQSQKEVRKSKNVCPVCHTRCGQAHTLPAPAPVPGSSRAPSPPLDSAGNSTPGSSKGEGYLECVNCQKSTAYNRYAQHLASCLGIGTGVRRTTQRNAVTKTKAGANGRSASPYIDESPEEPKVSKAKGKGKAGTEEDSTTGQKRAGTPTTSPTKKLKKGKASPLTGTGPPRQMPGSRLAFPGSNPKASSKLRSTPTPSVASHVSKNSHSPSTNSDESDAEGAGDSGGEGGEMESHSSLVSGISPSLPVAESIGRARGSKPGSFSSVAGPAAKNKKAPGGGPLAKKAQQAAPSLPVSQTPSVPSMPARRHESSFYLGDEGSETGSDTD